MASDDLKAVTTGTIKRMKTEGVLVVKTMKELMSNPAGSAKGAG